MSHDSRVRGMENSKPARRLRASSRGADDEVGARRRRGRESSESRGRVGARGFDESCELPYTRSSSVRVSKSYGSE